MAVIAMCLLAGLYDRDAAINMCGGGTVLVNRTFYQASMIRRCDPWVLMQLFAPSNAEQDDLAIMSFLIEQALLSTAK